jgi:predicted nucleic acid-binding protein
MQCVQEICACTHALAERRGTQSIEKALALVDKLQPLRDLVPEVLELAARTDNSVYDLFYLALARRTGATLLTADLALQRAAAAMRIDTPL